MKRRTNRAVPKNLAQLTEISAQMFSCAAAIKECVTKMDGYFDRYGNEAVLLESGRTTFNQKYAYLYLEKIDFLLPKMKVSVGDFDKEYSESQARNS